MALLRLLAPLFWASAIAGPCAEGEDCVTSYKLAWDARGACFFDGFEFQTKDENFGAVAYLNHSDALEAGVVETHSTHAILRTGARVHGKLKRQSVKLQAKKGWKHFFMMMRFNHLPQACGLWPAFWFLGLGKEWPFGGELDVLEWANDGPQQVSFHVGDKNRCTLDKREVTAYGPMPDVNNMSYDCLTDYSKGKLGCAPNKRPLLKPSEFGRKGGVIAVESTFSYMKVFYIPESELPSDIDTAEPKPAEWDKWVVSYMPFLRSEMRKPGSCPRSWDLVSPMHLIININLCGEWAGPIWKFAASCFNKMGPKFPSQCSIVDPIGNQSGLGDDCCTKFVIDEDEKYGTEQYLREHAFFNISYLKVFERSWNKTSDGSAEIVI